MTPDPVTVARTTILGVSAILLSAADQAPETVCQRLAPQLDMVATAAPRESAREWKVNLLGGLGTVLFGGSATTSFSVGPLDESTGGDYKRLRDACKTTTKGVICDVQGPARLSIGTKKGEVVTNVQAGERAVVEMRKTTIYCREG